MEGDPVFEIGDVVMLKSGGAAMTVYAADDWIDCVWHSRDGIVQRQGFRPRCLSLSEGYLEADYGDDE